MTPDEQLFLLTNRSLPEETDHGVYIFDLRRETLVLRHRLAGAGQLLLP